jgi:tetraacyldisaccharide 4'-kinase
MELLSVTTFQIPIISVGNLSVGGTGKTPHAEFILTVLQKNWKTAMLSRGYKRKTKGFMLGKENSDSQTIGDEPYQIYKKFPDVIVAVDEKRVHGVKKLQELFPDLQLVVLDDAFQHRSIKAGLSILLTDYKNLYTHDSMLPGGKLREWKTGSKRADLIVVTKCPSELEPIEMRLIEMELKPNTNQLLFFSTIIYDELLPVFPDVNPEPWTFKKMAETQAGVLLVAGIVRPEPIVEQLKRYISTIDTLFFDDHHFFQIKDFNLISQHFESLNSSNKILLVTEKDAARLVASPDFPEKLKSKTFAIPLRIKILQNKEKIFIQKIKNYVIENSRNH